MTAEEKKQAIADIPRAIKAAEQSFKDQEQAILDQVGVDAAAYEAEFHKKCEDATRAAVANIAQLKQDRDSKIAGLRAREKNLRSQISEDNENTSKPGKGKKSAARAARN